MCLWHRVVFGTFWGALTWHHAGFGWLVPTEARGPWQPPSASPQHSYPRPHFAPPPFPPSPRPTPACVRFWWSPLGTAAGDPARGRGSRHDGGHHLPPPPSCAAAVSTASGRRWGPPLGTRTQLAAAAAATMVSTTCLHPRRLPSRYPRPVAAAEDRLWGPGRSSRPRQPPQRWPPPAAAPVMHYRGAHGQGPPLGTASGDSHLRPRQPPRWRPPPAASPVVCRRGTHGQWPPFVALGAADTMVTITGGYH
ncbi:hypothetical protein BU14_0176s0004 [Porphyra umbilicalis]|uniref:Uncharacterized protein n=1 Tax=Porphyra umbilicalis TaxID=2786 RepID=A0A1X6P791_PORUM|nr:hypothetical protein BU14_0176s0004 [Porphyra umbilicalis]|eukprot:OSX76762.1 hypothetical protein BU14_0176s0004 [Porphyra umbilicalis]